MPVGVDLVRVAGTSGGAHMGTDAREMAIHALVQDSEAIRDTIEVVREKRQGDEAVVAATFRRSSGRLASGFVGLRRSDDRGWHAAGGGWSGGSRDVPEGAIWKSSGGWGSVTRGRGVQGGWVNEPAASVIRVTDPNGRVEEDTIEAGVAILIWEGDFDVFRATAELFAEDGRMIRSGPMRPNR
jgi:hypothetical protein